MLILLLMLCVALDVVRELCFKASSRAASAALAGGSYGSIAAVPRYAWMTTGIVLWSIEIFCWARVLSSLPLNLAYPIMSLTYAATPLAAWLVLGEDISVKRWLGIGLVTIGVMLIGLRLQ